VPNVTHYCENLRYGVHKRRVNKRVCTHITFIHVHISRGVHYSTILLLFFFVYLYMFTYHVVYIIAPSKNSIKVNQTKQNSLNHQKKKKLQTCANKALYSIATGKNSAAHPHASSAGLLLFWYFVFSSSAPVFFFSSSARFVCGLAVVLVFFFGVSWCRSMCQTRPTAHVKREMCGVLRDLCGVKRDLCGVKRDLRGVKRDLHGVKRDLRGVSLCQKRPSWCQKRPMWCQRRPMWCQKRPMWGLYVSKETYVVSKETYVGSFCVNLGSTYMSLVFALESSFVLNSKPSTHTGCRV